MPLNSAQRKLIWEKISYRPSSGQDKIHECSARIRLVAGGERSGKSFLSANDLTSRLFLGKLFWLVAADYERTKAEFNYVCNNLDKLGVRFTATKQVDPGEIEIEGGIRVATKSSKDPRKIAMEAPDGILVCEASQIDYETFLRLSGRLAEKRAWMLMSGTFESSLGWYVDTFMRGQTPNNDDLVSFSLPTWTNTAIFPGGRNDPEILRLERTTSPEWFMERYGGVPTPPRGLVFNEFRTHIHTGRGGKFEFDPNLDVYLWVDPGYATAYAIEVCQRHGDNLYVVDEIYERGLVTSDIIKVAKQKPWFGKVIGGATDIAATQHQAMAAPTEIWLREAGVYLKSTKLAIRDGIERVKSFLIVNPITSSPLLHINAACKGLISEMGGCPNPITNEIALYQWRLDNRGEVIGDAPEDKNNHACKALAYGLVDMFGYSHAKQKNITVRYF